MVYLSSTKPTGDEVVVHSTDKRLYLSREVMLSYGCKNCVWKSFHQCPKGFTEPEQCLDEGYCPELVNFIFRLAEKEDSITAVKEKFWIYTQELQAMADGMEFHKIESEYKRRSAEGASKQELAKLEMQVMSYKLWWSRLTEAITKGHSRIADREYRKEMKIEVNHKIELTQIHQLANDAKQVISQEKEVIEVEPDEETTK